MSDLEPRAICNECKPPMVVRIDYLLAHLLEIHGMKVEVEHWPDGAIVIHDTTLEPEDFPQQPMSEESGER